MPAKPPKKYSHKTVRVNPKKQPRASASQHSLTQPTNNLLDFKNMTEDHVLEIANKADELIEIIKNIKKTVKGDENKVEV